MKFKINDIILLIFEDESITRYISNKKDIDIFKPNQTLPFILYTNIFEE